MYKLIFKHIFDILVAIICFLLLLPLMIIIGIALSVSNFKFPFFIQSRPGKDGRIFKLIKFKTMNEKTDDEGNLLPDDLRLTKVGRIIRKTSLDEIPQLINVIKGEMSLVGPRPLLVEYIPLYDEFQIRRQEVKPGITGWAQVNGRNAISWQKKFELDVWYVDNISFMLDIRILILTVKKVFKSEGIGSGDSSTMGKFKVNN